MIIFGRGSTHLKSEHLKQISCPHCQSQDTVDISVYGNYAHVFWIPTFPIGKQGVSQCQHCKQTLKEKEMPDQFKQAFKAFKSTLKTPFWHFSGLLLIAVLIGWISYSGNQNDKANGAYIQAPLQGDVYEFKTDDGNYTLAKVVAVYDDSLEVVFNQYEINKASKLYTLNEPENYVDDSYIISKDDLVGLFEEGDILDVER